MQNKITDDEFARMVAEDVKNKLSPLHKKILLSNANWPRWQQALLALSDNLQGQIENIESDADSDNARISELGRDGAALATNAGQYYDAKATKVRRFKFHVDRRLDEVSSMIETGKEIETDGWERVDFFKKAIAQHRRLIDEFELEDTAIDRALWSTLENKWLFDSIDENDI